MRRIKHISKINLVLFLLSFCLFSVLNLSASAKGNGKMGTTYISARQGDLPDNTLQVSEENETENDFEILAFVIPFFFLAITIEIFRRTVFSYPEAINRAPRPIYVSIRNFRI